MKRLHLVYVLIALVGAVLAWLTLKGADSRSGGGSQTITVAIGTQYTTTNTAAAGVVIRQLHLLNKYLPHSGKYAGVKYDVQWQNFTSGPPITNGMMANTLQIGVMGDYPLVVNGYTFSQSRDSHSELIAIAAYNLYGSGNGIVVNKASSYYSLEDLKNKTVSVPFGSAAHGMMLHALKKEGLPENFVHLVNQAPEVGSTNLQEGKIDAHADFVPYPELFPFRGFARKIYDGAQIGLPTFHGVVVRTDFAEKYPEVVEAYLQAMLDADAWIKSNPQRAAELIAKWTGINKEVVYLYLGPSGIMTLDPTIKPALVSAAGEDVKTLEGLGRIKQFDVKPWVNDTYIRKVFAERGLDYQKALASTSNYVVTGQDEVCHRPVSDPAKAGELWPVDGPIKPYASAECLLKAIALAQAKGTKIDTAYLLDHARSIKIFASSAFFVRSRGGELVPFMLRKDAEDFGRANGAPVMDYDAALASLGKGSASP